MQRAAHIELSARQAYNAAMRRYLEALNAADGDDSQIDPALKVAVNRTGRAYTRAQSHKRQARAVFRALQR
jgi:hypothetical protein